MGKKYLSPYIKENNILQLSLFYFGKKRPKENTTRWRDQYGNECELHVEGEHGVPGAFEQDCYTACMRMWVKQGMPKDGIEVKYFDIAEELDLKPKRAWSSKIKKSLHILGGARYRFTQCFISATDGDIVDTYFSLFDNVSLRSKKYKDHNKQPQKNSKLKFPNEIRNNLECKYYQYLDMAWYKKLSSGLPRRLYEYLSKRRYHNVKGIFSISEEALCRWLPISDTNVTTRRFTIKKSAVELINVGYLKFYNFDNSTKRCIFEYAKDGPPDIDKVNQKMIKTSEEISHLIVEIINWLDSIPYLNKNRKSQIQSMDPHKLVAAYERTRNEYERLVLEGKTPKPNWVYSQFIEKSSKHKLIKQDWNIDKEKNNTKTQNIELNQLLELVKMKKITQKLYKVIEQHLISHGSEYVANCILYTNQKSKKNYSSYLQQVLVNNWAEEWAEEEREKINKVAKIKEEERKKIEEENREEQQKQYTISLQPLFLDKLTNIDNLTKLVLWEKAEQAVSMGQIGRSMNVKIEYAGLILSYLNANGEEFPTNITSDLGFVREIANNIGK